MNQRECRASVCRDGTCGLFCACECHNALDLRPATPDTEADRPPPTTISLSAIKFSRGRYHTHDALQQIQDMLTWHYGEVPQPTRAVAIKAREITLAIGALHDEGPEAIIMAPSVAGGIALTFIQKGRDISVACLNNNELLIVLGPRWFGALRAWEVAASESEQVIQDIRDYFARASDYDKEKDPQQAEAQGCTA